MRIREAFVLSLKIMACVAAGSGALFSVSSSYPIDQESLGIEVLNAPPRVPVEPTHLEGNEGVWRCDPRYINVLKIKGKDLPVRGPVFYKTVGIDWRPSERAATYKDACPRPEPGGIFKQVKLHGLVFGRSASYIGCRNEFVIEGSGPVWIAVNDDRYHDNEGYIDVRIKWKAESPSSQQVEGAPEENEAGGASSESLCAYTALSDIRCNSLGWEVYAHNSEKNARVKATVESHCKSGIDDHRSEWVVPIAAGGKAYVGCTLYNTYPYTTYCSYNVIGCEKQ